VRAGDPTTSATVDVTNAGCPIVDDGANGAHLLGLTQ
jgi:hypothetical protein